MRLHFGIAGNLYARAIVIAIAIMFVNSAAWSETAEPIKDAVCLDCHDGQNRSLEAGPHRLGSDYARPKVAVACVSCHAGAAAHLNDPGLETITTPAELSGHEAFVTCTQCHPAHVGLDNYGFDVHAVQEMNCIRCHKIHVYDKPLLLDDRGGFCLPCHHEAKTGFVRVSQHPVMQGNVTCLSCHRFIKRVDDRLGYDLAGICRDCHPAQGGPFPYEHEAVNGYSVEEGGCTECHNPHGSENDRLLVQPTSHLCRRCHAPVGHATAHGGIWAAYDCQVCHTDIHGSFVSNLFLDPALAAKLGGNCYDAGCHALNR
jgi:DmsE family decaheme c-type cytochrome